MPGNYFLDTNIVIYAYDPTDVRKHGIARRLLSQGLKESTACISSQVVQECLHYMTRKAQKPLRTEDTVYLCRNVLEPLCALTLPRLSLFYDALHIHERWRYGFYDALIIAAALKLSCPVLYSEDMQHGQRIEGLTIRNPFHK